MRDVDRATAARTDLAAFAELCGLPLTDWQVAGVTADRPISTVVGARQTGKSRAVSVAALHIALTRRRSRVLLVSASELGAHRLLASVREAAAAPAIRAAVLDESAGLLVLGNGSEVRAVAASERSVRGWNAELLVLDEAALIPDSIIAAALPVVSARRGRIILTSTPWGPSGLFHSTVVAGLSGDPGVAVAEWPISRCRWVPAELVETMRRTLPPARFAAEYEARFVSPSDRLFDAATLRDLVVDFPVPARLPGGVGGADWGNRIDSHAFVTCGVLADGGANGEPVLLVASVQRSQQSYERQVSTVAASAGALRLGRVRSESAGVGIPATEALSARLRGVCPVEAVTPTQAGKERAWGQLVYLAEARRLVLPADEQLLRELAALTASPTPSGGLRIEAPEAVHDDSADALALASSGVRLVRSRRLAEAEGWVSSAAGVRVPFPVEGGGRGGGSWQLARGRVPVGASAGRALAPVRHSDGSYGALPQVGGRK